MKRIMLQLLALLLAFASTSAAMAQTFSISSIGASNFGTVVSAASGQSIYRAAPASGTVTKVSGNAVRKSTNTARSFVTIACGNQTACGTANARIVITTTGTPTGRAAALQNFTISTSGASASIAVAPGTGSSITFQIGPVGQNSSKTFWVGYDMPLNGDNGTGTTGAAGSALILTVSRTNGAGSSSLSSTIGATVFRSIAMTKTTDLSFGRIAVPSSGSATVSLAPATGAVTLSGGARKVSSVASTAAAFSVSGEGGQAVTVTVPSTITMTGPGGDVSVTTSATGSGSQTLSGSIGSAGTLSPTVGGSFSLPSTLAPGSYTGTFSVTVQYN